MAAPKKTPAPGGAKTDPRRQRPGDTVRRASNGAATVVRRVPSAPAPAKRAAPAVLPARRAAAPGQAKKALGLQSARSLTPAKLGNPSVAQKVGRSYSKDLSNRIRGGKINIAANQAKGASSTASAKAGFNPIEQIGSAIGKVFPAGRSGNIKNAMTTYGRLDNILKGKR